MHETERIVRIFRESWNLRDPERGASLQSNLGAFPPSGRFVEARCCSVMRVAGGKVVEGRDYYDSSGIARQLGLIDD